MTETYMDNLVDYLWHNPTRRWTRPADKAVCANSLTSFSRLFYLLVCYLLILWMFTRQMEDYHRFEFYSFQVVRKNAVCQCEVNIHGLTQYQHYFLKVLIPCINVCDGMSTSSTLAPRWSLVSDCVVYVYLYNGNSLYSWANVQLTLVDLLPRTL